MIPFLHYCIQQKLYKTQGKNVYMMPSILVINILRFFYMMPSILVINIFRMAFNVQLPDPFPPF